MLDEVLEALLPGSGRVYVDGTLGGGNHAEAILEASSPGGRLHGFDRDEEAIAAARQRLQRFSGRFEIYREDFANMAQRVEPESCDGVLLDLGVSSHQLDTPERGFSFQSKGPLDMRMDGRGTPTAADLVNELSETDLARIFWEWGEEPQGRRLARAIVNARKKQRLETTEQLAQLVERWAPRYGKKKHPATRVFQALRMAVNREANSLQRGLAAACLVLKPGGRLVVITFHSIEDRIVKQFGKDQSRDYVFPGERDIPELRQPRTPILRWVAKKPILPSSQEIDSNPRARSAKLRVLEKV